MEVYAVWYGQIAYDMVIYHTALRLPDRSMHHCVVALIGSLGSDFGLSKLSPISAWLDGCEPPQIGVHVQSA